MWGTVIRYLVQGLNWGGAAAIGYFMNDLGTWVAKATGTESKVTDSTTGKFQWWYILLIAVFGGVILYTAITMLGGIGGGKRGRRRRYMISFVLVSLAVVDTVYGMGGLGIASGVVTAKFLGSIAASSPGTFTINYCPEYITFNIATVPTLFSVNPTGDGLVMQLDGDGLTALSGIRQVGAMASNQYYYQIADGYVQKSTTFNITNAQASQLDVYGWSDSPATMYVTHLTGHVNANAFVSIENFAYLAFPDATSAARFVITWRDGTTDEVGRDELLNYLAWTQQVTTGNYNIDNMERRISKVQYTDTAAQSYYYTRYNTLSGVINQVQ